MVDKTTDKQGSGIESGLWILESRGLKPTVKGAAKVELFKRNNLTERGYFTKQTFVLPASRQG